VSKKKARPPVEITLGPGLVSGRTISRINEHSGEGHELRIIKNRELSIFDGRRCCLFACKCADLFWLPNNEWQRKKDPQTS
jgi:hypothetical protein